MNLGKEINPPFSNAACALGALIFPRIDIDCEEDFSSLCNLDPLTTNPILVKNTIKTHHSGWTNTFFQELLRQYIIYAKKLTDRGFNNIVIAADGDSAWQKILSPRSSSLDFNQRKAPFLELYATLTDFAHKVVVLLTVEELAPSGLDATDGILIAQDLERLGLKEIIATSGTKDFPPLYDRRSTRKKPTAESQFCSNSPHLASAVWLLEHTDLSVWCSAFFDDRDLAITLARRLGIAGLIEKEA